MHSFLAEISTMHPELRKTGDCAQADHVLQELKLCRMSAEQEEDEIFYGKHLLKSTSTTQAVVSLSSAEADFYAAVKAAAAGIGCVSMMRDLGVMLQQQGVEVKAKGLDDNVDSLSLEIKIDATAGRAICNATRCRTYQTYRNTDAMVATSRDQW